ncbi:MAG: sigma 54-interacting transcriptional regulator [Candidatus Eisenbacteria bacterium]|nr:sigma 54-interacting transcriptional regulator [Candidatus Eisenbacteria bacterium]
MDDPKVTSWSDETPGAASEAHGNPSAVDRQASAVDRAGASAGVSSGTAAWTSPEWTRALELGDVHLATENLATAIEYFERARNLFLAAGVSPASGGWERALQAGERATLISIDLRIAECLRARGQHAEAERLLNSVLATHGSSLDVVARARTLARLGEVEIGTGAYATGLHHCEQAYEVLRSTSENDEIGRLELSMGTIAFRLGQVSRSCELFESALFTFRRIDDRAGIARALNNLGITLGKGARWREALDYLSRALSVSEEAGNFAKVAHHCLNLGILLSKTGQWNQSQQHLARALLVFRETGKVVGQARATIALGILKLRLGQERAAASQINTALLLAREHGHIREEALALEFLGEAATLQGDFKRAESLLDEGLQIGLKTAPEGDIVAEVLRRQADLRLAQGRPAAAIEAATSCIALAHVLQESVECGAALRTLALASAETGRLDHALALARASVDLLGQTPDVVQQAHSRRALAALLLDQASVAAKSADARPAATEAVALWEDAAGRYQELELHDAEIATLADLAQGRAWIGELDEAFATLTRAIAAAEGYGLGAWIPRLEQARTTLEERLAEDSLARSAEYQLLQEIAGLSPTDLDSSMLACLRMALQRSNSDRCAFALCEPGRHVKLEAHVGFDDAAVPGLIAFLDGLAPGFRAGRKLFVENASRESVTRDRSVDSRAEGSGVASVALPVPAGDRALGILYLQRDGALRHEGARSAGAYRNPDLRLLSLFAGLLSAYVGARERERIGRGGRDPVESNVIDPYRDFVTCSSELRRSLNLLRKIEDSNVSILVSGETGTGKGLLARLIHDAGARCSGPFVPINCAALPETLLESELFGHVQGAFTGAVRAKRGLFEEATGGSIFLDEVDKAPMGVQAKLLHVLDRHEIRPVGGTKWSTVDVRVICATNADLRRAITEGRFLEDLYYRLNDFQIHIPPLRERREDIPLLVRRFYQQFCRELGRSPLGLSRDVIQVLSEHEWRGNVRELEKVVKRMLVLAEDGEIISGDLLPRDLVSRANPANGGSAAGRPSGTLRAEIQRLEARMIRDALETTKGNKSEAARQLHLSYPSLLAKIKQYGLEPSGAARAV